MRLCALYTCIFGRFVELERAAEVAEEHRVQDFQHALEPMVSVEAEASLRTERERTFRTSMIKYKGPKFQPIRR